MQVARPLDLEPGAAPERRTGASAPRPRKAQGARRTGRPPLAAIGAGFLIWASLVGLGVVYVYREADIARQGRELQELRGAISRVEEENRALQAQVAQLSSIQRIKNEALRLGLVPPNEVEVAQVNRAAVLAAMTSQRQRVQNPTTTMAARPQEPGFWARVQGYLTLLRSDPSPEQAAPSR